MSSEKYYLGPAPADEQCVQVGSEGYEEKARAECKRYIEAIKQVCGEPPEGARLKVESQAHDYGSYLEVVVEFDPSKQAAQDYASKCDEHAPRTWPEPKKQQTKPAKIRFQPGTVVATIGATQVANHFQMIEMLRRHLSGDWGDVDSEDAKANEHAVKFGERILSSYRTPSGEKLWLLTEADRSATTILTPGEY